INRSHNAGTRWRAAAKLLLPAAFPPSSPTTGHLGDSCLQPFLDQTQDPTIGHAMLDELHGPFVAHVVKETANVSIEHPVHSLPLDAHRQRVQRLVWAATGPKPVREAFEVHLIDLVEARPHSLLNNFVPQRRDA